MTTTSDRQAATIDLPGLDETLQAFGESRMLPGAAYTSDEVFAWEQRHLFAGQYTCVGREDELRAPGEEGKALTQRAVKVGDVHVLLTWDGDDIHAFANTCRHRAHELVEADGGNAKRAIVCPYHAWTYDLSGSLRAAPGYKGNDTFDAENHGLVELPVERWQGWVFVHAATSLASGEALPFTEYIGELDRFVSAYDPASLGARRPALLRRRGELEGDLRELPRVLPLPSDPPGALPGHTADVG